MGNKYCNKLILNIVFVMVFLFPVFLHASTFSMSMDCPSKVAAGDTVSCTIKASVDNTIEGLSAKFNLGETTFVSFDQGSDLPKATSADADGFVFFSASPLFDSSKTITVGTLKVKIPNEGSSFTVKLKDVTGSANGSDIDVQDISKTMKIASTDSTLNKLFVTELSISPVFSPDKTSYTVSDTKLNSITINATANDDGATVSGAGTKTLKYGNNEFKITVKSEAGTTTVYTIKVMRIDDRDSTFTLDSLAVKGYTITPEFDQYVKEYKLKVESTVKSVDIEATLTGNLSKFKSKYGPRTVSLKYGKNTVKVIVIAENETENTYVIDITRDDGRDDNNFLSNLSIDAGKLNFSRNTITYNVNVKKEVSEITISATAESEKAKISGTGKKKLKEGKNSFDIKVTAENESVLKYTIVVNRVDEVEKPSEPFITSLSISNAKINFDTNTTTYDVEISSRDTELKIDYKVSSGVSSKVVGNENLKDGSIVKIMCYRDDEEAKYTFNIKKEEKEEEVVTKPEEKSGGNIVLYIIIGLVLVVGGVVAFILLSKKKLKKSKEEEAAVVEEPNNDNEVSELLKNKSDGNFITTVFEHEPIAEAAPTAVEAVPVVAAPVPVAVPAQGAANSFQSARDIIRNTTVRTTNNDSEEVDLAYAMKQESAAMQNMNAVQQNVYVPQEETPVYQSPAVQDPNMIPPANTIVQNPVANQVGYMQPVEVVPQPAINPAQTVAITQGVVNPAQTVVNPVQPGVVAQPVVNAVQPDVAAQSNVEYMNF